jgi:hypothetical protein
MPAVDERSLTASVPATFVIQSIADSPGRFSWHSSQRIPIRQTK